ncbi:MAG: N-acetylglucosamine-6-phosphate deacetylase, partial [Alphaproteobacteria bacterium]|nr:N-acetylglucosamine-6-phosphate deacetylase [Alphaproteobacteria bacterium]
ESCEVERLPAGVFIAPGFIDIQVNGGGGVLLNATPTAEGMVAIARAHRAFGTAALLPTFITDTQEKTKQIIAAAKSAVGRDGVMGLHLEGPFINPARAGVHPTEYIRCPSDGDLEWVRLLANVGCAVITLAPECVPAGFIRTLVSLGIRVWAGHSEATAEQMHRAIDEGLSGVTHLFNAMPPLRGREPGIIGTTLADPRLTAGIIMDGLHVSPISVRAAFAAKGSDRIALVTDAMPTVGANTQQFDLMKRSIYLQGGRLVTGEGILAGAHLDMTSALRNAIQLARISLEDALISAGHTPARSLGLDRERGTLVTGARADMIALNQDLQLVGTWIGGVRQ